MSVASISSAGPRPSSRQSSSGAWIQCVVCQEVLRREDDLRSLRMHISNRHSSNYAPFKCDACDTEFGDPYLLEVPNWCCPQFDPEAAQKHGHRNVTAELFLRMIVDHSLEKAKGEDHFIRLLDKLEGVIQDFEPRLAQQTPADSGVGSCLDIVKQSPRPSEASVLGMGADASSLPRTSSDSNVGSVAAWDSVSQTGAGGEVLHCTLCDEPVAKNDISYKAHLKQHLADRKMSAKYELDDERIDNHYQQFFDPYKFRCAKGKKCGFPEGRKCKSWKESLEHSARRHLPPALSICGYKKCTGITCSLRADCLAHNKHCSHPMDKFQSHLTADADRKVVQNACADFKHAQMPRELALRVWAIDPEDLDEFWPESESEDDDEEEGMKDEVI